MNRLLHQIRDILPAAGIILVMGIAAFILGYFLMKGREKVVRMGNSQEARGLRTLEQFEKGDQPGVITMESGVVMENEKALPDPTGHGDPVVFYRHVAIQRIQKNSEDRRIGGGDMNYLLQRVLVDQGGVDFRIKADDGRVYTVKVDSAVSALAGGTANARAKSGYGVEAPEYFKKVAERNGLSLTQVGMNKELTLTTWLLRPGDRVTVVAPYFRNEEGIVLSQKDEFPVVLMNTDLKAAKQELESGLE